MSATFGILIFQEPLRRIYDRLHLPARAFPFLSVTLGATLGSLPLIIYHFQSVALASIVINILISFVLGWILFTAVLYVPIISISEWIGYHYGYILYIPTKYIIILSEYFAQFPKILFTETWATSVALILIGIYSVLLLWSDLLREESGTHESISQKDLSHQ
jgi:competence protein ComEC